MCDHSLLSASNLSPPTPKPEHHEIKQQQKGCENHSNDRHQPHSLLSDHYIGVYDYVELDYI